MKASPHSVMNCDIAVSEFKLQSHHYVHFQNNTLGKNMKSSIPMSAMS